MNYNSLFFVLVFLPASLIIYYGVSYFSKKNKISKRITLLALSLFSYLYASGFIYLGVIIGVTLLHFLLALLLSRVDKLSHRRILLWTDIIISAGMLLFFKYINILTTSFTLAFPLGLSF